MFPSKEALKRHKRAAHASATGQPKPVTRAEQAKAEAQARKTAVAAAVEAQPGAVIDELADASRLELEVAQRCVARLLGERQILPVPLADGVVGYRLRSHGLDVVEDRLGHSVSPPSRISPSTIEDIGRLLAVAGLPVHVRDEATLVVGGTVISPPRSVLADPDAVSRWYDGFVLDAHAVVLAKRAHRHFKELAPTLALESRAVGVAVLDGRPDAAAMIGPTAAVLRGGTVVPGNFLAEGAHWYLLRDLLSKVRWLVGPQPELTPLRAPESAGS